MAQIAVGSGYMLHYLDEKTGEHVSIPLDQLEATHPKLVHDEILVVKTDLDRRALARVFAKPDLDNLSPYAPLEKRRPDWQDRGPKHNNRKKRSWRR